MIEQAQIKSCGVSEMGIKRGCGSEIERERDMVSFGGSLLTDITR